MTKLHSFLDVTSFLMAKKIKILKTVDKKTEELAGFYDNADLTKVGSWDKAKIQKINIGIPSAAIRRAKKLANISGNSYQNTLKTAMSIGLKQLEKEILS